MEVALLPFRFALLATLCLFQEQIIGIRKNLWRSSWTSWTRYNYLFEDFKTVFEWKTKQGIMKPGWHAPPRNSTIVTFCLETSLHGLKYIGQQKRHCFERIFWLSAFIVAAISSGLLIWEMWKAFSSMPIVTVFNPAEKTIDEISFPAVTVCNVNKVRKSFVKKVQNRYLNAESLFPDEEWLQAYAELRDVGHICEASRTFTQTFINRSDPNFNNTYKELRLGTELPTNISCYKKAREEISDPQKMLRRGSQNCSEMILYCLWLDQPYSCSDLFTQIQTDYGFCCSFNMIPKELMFKNSTLPSDPELQQRIQEWKDADVNYENLVSQGGNSDDYPKKQLRSGRSSGLSFLIDPELDEYFCSNSDSGGFMVTLNSPLDLPKVGEDGIAIQPGSEVFISVQPQITIADESIKKFSLEKRECYFASEKRLRYFSHYTLENCMAECITLQTLKRCECVRYYMPHDPETDPICKSTLYNCVRDVRKRINQLGWGKSCTKCYPTCTQIHYQSQVSSLRINKKYTEALLKDQISAPEDVSIVHVYFGEDTVHPKLRKELYTFVNLMSNTGGLLGLCMGFSFLSLLEILYYFTIRNIFKYLRFKSGDNTEDTDVHINEVDFRPAVITDKDKTSNMVDKMAMVESMDSRFNSKIFPELYGLSSFKK